MLKIRTYPHFDKALTPAEAEALACDPKCVAAHAFHPFISYSERFTKFAKKGRKPKTKSRPIMYASRRDSCIYVHYRSLLSQAYENELADRRISPSVLAYRCIPRVHGKGNKSNIHFASDVFEEIAKHGDCIVYTFDVSKFFDTLDHSILKRQWIHLLGFKTMPPDHYRVFRSITKFSSVDREKLYWALGFIGVKSAGHQPKIGYKVERVPMQVCSGKEFRKKVCGLLKTNRSPLGIPQGSPMSDVLANLYMLDFDAEMSSHVSTVCGSYRRYSDDILVVVPGHADNVLERLASIEKLLWDKAGNLQIQPNKTTVHKFSVHPETCEPKCELLHGTAGKNGLEYLGFRFDGRRVFIRDSTRARLQRKMTFAVRAAVNRLHLANPRSGRAELKKLFNSNVILDQFYKVRDFESKAQTPKAWTFWTYVIRAQQVFGDRGRPIARQVRGFRTSIVRKAERFIDHCTTIP